MSKNISKKCECGHSVHNHWCGKYFCSECKCKSFTEPAKDIWEIAEENPDQWLHDDFFDDEEQLWDLAEGGGCIMYCTTCGLHAQPNRPCFCGAWVIQRSDGKFWAQAGKSSQWTDDWRYCAEHFWDRSSAGDVASALTADSGVLALRRIEKGWESR